MCGIAGLVTFGEESQAEQILQRMCSVLKHRGPDDQGIYVSPNRQAFLGQTRLSIIDLVTGHQPISGEDGKFWVVFNGEIYNFQELREPLIRHGHRFKTNSDTEVILHLYEEKGVDCVHDLRGMFAFAVWDERDRSLFLARDRLGKKPLSYFYDGKRFLFASEIKAILEHPAVPRRVRREALDYYLTFLYTPPPISMFEDIAKLPPAHWLYFKDGKINVQRYWQPRVEVVRDNYADWVARLHTTLSEAVKLRLISDVPLGAFLSGGVDSSLIVGLMGQASPERVKTFSIGFEEEEYSELKYARAAANYHHTDHHEMIVMPDAMEVLPKLVWHYDEPFGDSSMIPTYYVAQETRRHVKVALSGDGGDELFAGYTRYKILKYLAKLKRIPPILQQTLALGTRTMDFVHLGHNFDRAKRLLYILDTPISDLYLEIISSFNAAMKDRLLTDSFHNRSSFAFFTDEFYRWETDAVTAAQYTDLMTYLPYDILVKVDIASMANSLEVRCPFLDHKVVELAFQMPVSLKLRGNATKFILKRTFEKLIPPRILTRGKWGFAIPLKTWFRGKLQSFLTDTILSRRALERGYFKRVEVERLVDEHIKGYANHDSRLWLLLNFELWHRIFIDR